MPWQCSCRNAFWPRRLRRQLFRVTLKRRVDGVASRWKGRVDTTEDHHGSSHRSFHCLVSGIFAATCDKWKWDFFRHLLGLFHWFHENSKWDKPCFGGLTNQAMKSTSHPWGDPRKLCHILCWMCWHEHYNDSTHQHECLSNIIISLYIYICIYIYIQVCIYIYIQVCIYIYISPNLIKFKATLLVFMVERLLFHSKTSMSCLGIFFPSGNRTSTIYRWCSQLETSIYRGPWPCLMISGNICWQLPRERS